MKVRYEIKDMDLKISNVTIRDAETSYVLVRAFDEVGNEIAIALSHAQSEYLENELYEANRRRKENVGTSTQYVPDEFNEDLFSLKDDYDAT